MSLMWSWHWSPLTQTSLLLSPSDGLASFLKTTLANGVKVVKKVITSKFRFHLIAIYALGCLCNFSCTPVPTKITLGHHYAIWTSDSNFLLTQIFFFGHWIGTDCIGSCRSNYHMITAPKIYDKNIFKV